MVNRDYEVLNKILDETNVIIELIKGFDCAAFLLDERTKRAVSMTLINIGELVKLLSDDFKQANTVIPWRKVAGLRDVAAHGYQILRMEDIWSTATTDVPVLQETIIKMINSLK